MTTIAAEPETETMAELLERLGRVPPERVLLRPQPGTATEIDVLRFAHSANKRLCELIDGVLVEKAMGFIESCVAAALVELLRAFVREHRLGIVLGADGTVRVLPGQVRIPDVAFYSYQRLPNGRAPTEPIPALAPDLAVEVLSPSNTRGEMERTRSDYFAAGVRLIWEIDPRTRRAVAWTTVDRSESLTAADSLNGLDILPGLSIPLAHLFADLDDPSP